MFQEILLAEVTLPTFGTLEGFLPSVFPVVDFQVIFAEELFVTCGTFDRNGCTFSAVSGLGCERTRTQGWLGCTGFSNHF